MEDVWHRIEPDVVACYEKGRRAIPTMTTGRVTLHAAVDRSGATTCAVPSDDTGLTQEVEDCALARLARERYPAGPTETSIAIPIVVRDARVSLGQISAQPMIETIESNGLAEDIYDVIEKLLPDAKTCLLGQASGGNERRVVYVGARVGKSGNVECALASSTSPIASEARQCVAKVFTRAHFQAPKHGTGLLSVPIAVSKNY